MTSWPRPDASRRRRMSSLRTAPAWSAANPTRIGSGMRRIGRVGPADPGITPAQARMTAARRRQVAGLERRDRAVHPAGEDIPGDRRDPLDREPELLEDR